jgi:hypothetical protein
MWLRPLRLVRAADRPHRDTHAQYGTPGYVSRGPPTFSSLPGVQPGELLRELIPELTLGRPDVHPAFSTGSLFARDDLANGIQEILAGSVRVHN